MNLDKILKVVERPSRYIGNEFNSVHKDLNGINIRFGFCFADVYEIGMSHLGMKILYHLLNSAEDIYCERFFTPWVDMEEQMRKNNIPLFSLETKTPARDFDFLGFTLQYEMSYTNILNMLDLGGIPLRSDERDDSYPIICAGGPCAYNPEPLAPFVDLFMMGEGEEVMMEVMDLYRTMKAEGKTKDEFLAEVVKIEGIYVPKFYDVEYNEDGTIKSFTKNYDAAPDTVKKRIIKDFDKCFAPDNIIVPFMEVVHDRIMLEIFRGCIRGCRFCQAGMIYRPVRERSPETLLSLAERLIKNTGYEEISLSSLSTSDYTRLKELTDGLLDLTEEQKISLSLPSLRLDNFSMELMQKVQKVRKSGLTFAPEAGTQRLRDVINKNITEEDLTNAAQMAFNGGYGTIKLYFMIGLPTETNDDIAGIAHLADEVVSIYKHTPKEIRNKNLRVTVSVSSFVPKPFTPFQWVAQNTKDEIFTKQMFLKEQINNRYVSYNWHDSALSILEGIVARGDRKLADAIEAAFKNGARFDSWHEHFRPDVWYKAFEQAEINPDFYNTRERDYEEILPWDFIDVGVSKKFLISESEKSKRGETTKNCREGCSGCGVMQAFGGGLCG